MSNNLLRAPLVKSAILLSVFILIIFLTVTSHEGSVWSSLGTIFYAVFKAAQLGVGLILALILCLAILVGIFLGCMAMVSTDSATKMYNHLRRIFSEKMDFVKTFLKKEEDRNAGMSFDELRSMLKTEVAGHVESSLHNIRKPMEESLESLQSRIEQIELDDRYSIISDRLKVQEVQLGVIEDAEGKGKDDIQKLGEQLREITQQIQEMNSDKGMADLTERITSLESKKNEIESLCTSLAQKVESLREEVEALKTVYPGEVQEAAQKDEEDESEQRLFSYIENPQDKEKIAQLVAEGIKNEMTYTQIMDQLTRETDEATAEAIAAHPSLTKDYIRYIKKMS